ncbi:GIY-YIG nuclease family protein [Undibacterium arcticum]|uniref:Excinuclease cho n=1 Tax=Undibacterium arcticum TaxID=1762892 RepID=A0ABV7F9M0_9BURK
MQARITSVGLVIQPDPSDLFVYPDHIDRASLDALPPRPGIYIFRDQHDTPLYIGKSVNIRSRVLSHLNYGLCRPNPASDAALGGATIWRD